MERHDEVKTEASSRTTKQYKDDEWRATGVNSTFLLTTWRDRDAVHKDGRVSVDFYRGQCICIEWIDNKEFRQSSAQEMDMYGVMRTQKQAGAASYSSCMQMQCSGAQLQTTILISCGS